MKNFLNIFGIITAFCIGFGIANTTNPKIISKEEYTNNCTLVKDALDKAANPKTNLANLFEDNFEYYGGELPCVRVYCNIDRLTDINHNAKRSKKLFFNNTQFEIYHPKTDKLTDVFLEPTALDKYVIANWDKKWL
jgi:hypothetical protein